MTTLLMGMVVGMVLVMVAPTALAGCGGTYLAAKGTIKSPGYPRKYPNNQRCIYTIKASADSKLKFWCNRMNLEWSVGCKKDWLAVNGVYTCGRTKLKNVYGEGELRVEFRSDSTGNRKRKFLCYYQRVTGGEYVATTTISKPGQNTTTQTTKSKTTPSAAQSQATFPSCTNAFIAKYNYAEVLHKSLLFYEAQRSGYLPSTQRVKWRRDSATQDALDSETNIFVNLEGGYYDAGDYVKFGYPMASATSVLAWGAIEYSVAYSTAGEMGHMLDAVKWATDYFIKAHVQANVLYGQVGDGDLDHQYWGRPEDMTMRRPAFKITQSKPGSDLAGETAAALAAASILFKQTDSAYSLDCLQHARELYSFADRYRGKYAASIPEAAKFYNSYGVYDDELAWAAIWLYRATGNRQYLYKAKQHYSQINPSGISEFSWAEKTPGVMVLLAQLADAADKPKYSSDLQKFCDKIIKNTQRTPKGLVFISKWGTLRYAANVAFVCLRAADLGIKTTEYRLFGRQQIDYMLGDGGRSYVVGFGHNPPQRPHHASSSCKNPPASCSWQDFSSPQPNAHVLYGALVGGPDSNDKYTDNRTDYVTNEVTCDYNAGFQSAVAALRQLSSCGQPSITTTAPSTQPPNTASCVSIKETAQWQGNYQANLIIKVPVATSSWSIKLTFSHPVTNFQVWVADASPTFGTVITLTNKYYNGNQSAGATLIIKFWVTFSGTKPVITSINFGNKQLCIN